MSGNIEKTISSVYSPSENAIYPSALYSDYIAAGTWPKDGIFISDGDVRQFNGGNKPSGKMLGMVDGKLAWVDLPPPTADELIAAATAKKGWLIAEASQVIAPLLDAKDGGYIDDADKPTLVAWQKYRYALTKVEPAKPVWPEKPAE